MNYNEYKRNKLVVEELEKHVDQIGGTANFLVESRLTRIQKNQVWNIINNSSKLAEWIAFLKQELKRYENRA